MATLIGFLILNLWIFQFMLGFYLALYLMFGEIRCFTNKVILFVLIKLFVGLAFLIAHAVKGLNWLYLVNSGKPVLKRQIATPAVSEVEHITPARQKPATVTPTAKELAETETPTTKTAANEISGLKTVAPDSTSKGIAIDPAELDKWMRNNPDLRAANKKD